SSTSNSDFKKFVAKLTARLLLLAVVCLCVFFIPLKRTYYTGLMKYSDYSKIDWIENKLDHTQSLDSTIVFVGSSICLNGINDSLINALDTTSTQYLNLGMTHTCFAIIDALLEDMLERRQLRPKKVLLCFKGNAMARNIHNMYPAYASPSLILSSVAQNNTYFFSSILKRVSWNVHYLTRGFKMNEEERSKEFNSTYGFKPLEYLETEKVEKSYRSQRAGSEANFNAIQSENEGNARSLKTDLILAYTDMNENVSYQRHMFERAANRLDAHDIPYDIIVYPNLVSARMEKQDIMANYIRRTFPSIDYNQHRIITANDTAFANARYYNDMNHMNPDGAELLSRYIYSKLR
ncbi:MAG: hypothetical protein ACKOZM_02595, partial [Flavobacteriales bacterium]